MCNFARNAVLACLVLCALASASAADTRKVVTRCTTDLLEETLEELGYKLKKLDDNVFRIEADGFTVMFINKKLDVQLYAGWKTKASIDHVNAFNRKVRWVRAYIDDEGDPVLEADLDFEGGVTQDSFERFIRLFVQVSGAYANHLSEGKPDGEVAKRTAL